MGTPNFALATLSKLIASDHDVIAVYTMPPNTRGRGNKVSKSPIQLLAEQNGLRVYSPKNFKNDADYQQFKELEADLAVVVAYGAILPAKILKATKYGCINIHPSSLPRWRGAAPIQHTILSGDTHTSVCIIQMDEGMDTGDTLLKHDLAIAGDITSTGLHDVASDIGADLALEVIGQIENGTTNPIKQSSEGVTYARKIDRSDEKLNFNQSAYLVNAQVRTFSPKPGAYFSYNNENIKVIKASYDADLSHNVAAAGTVIDDNLTIACAQGALRPLLLQREGRKAIYLDAFLRGFKIPAGTAL